MDMMMFEKMKRWISVSFRSTREKLTIQFRQKNMMKTKKKNNLIQLDCNNLYGKAIKASKSILCGLTLWSEYDPGDYGFRGWFEYPESYDLQGWLSSGTRNTGNGGKNLFQLTDKKKKLCSLHWQLVVLTWARDYPDKKSIAPLLSKRVDWIEVYIEKNTKLRQQSKKWLEKDFYKLANNAFYGEVTKNAQTQHKSLLSR
jgi:hypothetical protein